MSALPAPTTAQTAQTVRTVVELIARHAERTPDALALLDGTTAVTYRELHETAGRLASVLAARGVGPGHAVGLLCARAARLAVAQLAIWRAGGHVVPLDPAYPRPRLAETIEDTGALLVLGDKALLAETGLPAERTLVLGDHDGDSAWGAAPDEARSDQPALIFHTSGSTGRPKGVLVPHRAVTDLVTAPDALALGPRDRVLFHSALGFDATTFELWAPLAHGAAVAVSSADRPTAEDLVRDVERYGVTTLFLTTALFHHLAARQSRIFGVLRTLAVGGEALSPEYAGAVLRAFPWLELYNVYGPTEATTFTTLHRITAADCTGEAPVPIGRPFGGARTLVLDEHQEPVAPGESGELWIAGARVAQGYLNRPELTADRFRELPGAGRAYRSGDVVRQRPDGALEFHGRTDDQVKVRGFRIEPGEVEQALLRHPEVAEAAVVVRHPGAADAALTACVVLVEGHRPSVGTLRERLAEQLPAHLVPTAWAVLDELPLNGSGKVDRKALAAAPGDRAEAGAVADLTPIQQVVAEAWARALGRPVTDPAADFLAEGGHSLLAMWIVDDLREDLGAELSLADFLGHPTVAAQADLLEQALRAAHDPAAADPAPAGSAAPGSATTGEETVR